MDILVNELSLNGQFNDIDNFLNNLEELLYIIKVIDDLDFNFLKEYNFFNCQITSTQNFMDIAKSKDTRVRKLKSFLLKLSNNPPFWNETQIHDCDTATYTYISRNICGSSLAESYERDQCILSFWHSEFSENNLLVYKDKDSKKIYNFIEKNIFLDELLSRREICPAVYCTYKFKGTNLNFSNYEENYGFSSLDNFEQIETFLNAFHDFSLMTWDDIMTSDGLEYKKYNKPKKKKIKGWFKEGTYKNTDIYKFRVTQEYRCFGYRVGDEFFVLRFEIDHSISNNG